MESNLRDLLYALSGFGSQKMEDVGFASFFFVLVTSFLASMLISYLFLHFYSSRSTGSQIHRSFPLLGISITAIFVCIQFSLPLSLGLLGALSIVRFRTPIKEPEEIGFLMLLISSSIACGTFNFIFLVIILVVAIISIVIYSFVLRLISGGSNEGLIIIRLPGENNSEKNSEITKILETEFPKGFLEGIANNGEESVLTYSFAKVDQDNLRKVQSEIENLDYAPKYNIFFNRPNAL